VERTTGVLKEAFIKLSKAAEEKGLNNQSAPPSPKNMETTKRPTNSRMLKVDDQEFERVREFRHLESSLAGDNNITIEMKQGILMTN
jgi:hypothetical protein